MGGKKGSVKEVRCGIVTILFRSKKRVPFHRENSSTYLTLQKKLQRVNKKLVGILEFYAWKYEINLQFILRMLIPSSICRSTKREWRTRVQLLEMQERCSLTYLTTLPSWISFSFSRTTTLNSFAYCFVSYFSCINTLKNNLSIRKKNLIVSVFHLPIENDTITILYLIILINNIVYIW